MTKQNVGMAREREQSACWWPLTNTRLNTNIEVHNKFGKCSFLGEPIGKSDVMQSFFSMSSTQTKHSRNIHQKWKKKTKHYYTQFHTYTHIQTSNCYCYVQSAGLFAWALCRRRRRRKVRNHQNKGVTWHWVKQRH